jgi:hypothetical protein
VNVHGERNKKGHRKLMFVAEVGTERTVVDFDHPQTEKK